MGDRPPSRTRTARRPPTRRSETELVSDLPRILTIAAQTPMMPELRHAALVALWMAVAHLVPTDRFKDLESLIGALEAAYNHYGREQFAAGLRHARMDAREECAAGVDVSAPTVH